MQSLMASFGVHRFFANRSLLASARRLRRFRPLQSNDSDLLCCRHLDDTRAGHGANSS